MGVRSVHTAAVRLGMSKEQEDIENGHNDPQQLQ